jgi:alkylhydroperoxidase/carboxymuconolactone decarboxylase family protein YurZ
MMDEKQIEALKERVMEAAGYWHPFHEALLGRDPQFLSAYLEMSHGSLTGVVSQRMKELIFITVDGTVQHLYEPGLRYHIPHALSDGATEQEVLEALQIACACVWTTQAIALSRLARFVDVMPRSEEQRTLEAFYREQVGRWPEWASALFSVKPAFAKAFFDFCAIPWNTGTLSAKEKELLYFAGAVTPTVANEGEAAFHADRARGFGATSEEIVEVAQLAGAVAIHTCIVGVPILASASEKHRERAGR